MFNFGKLFELWGEYFSEIFYATISTIILAVLGTVIGLVLGIFLAYGKNVKIKKMDNPFIKILKGICVGFCNIYSTIIRGTPMMVQALIFKYFCMGIGINWDALTPNGVINQVFNGWLYAGLIVITFNTAAYMGEIVRSGLNGVDVGQVEGARSLGLSSFKTSIHIVLPQALKNAIPTIGNELIVNIKDSSVLNVIAVTELYYRMYIIGSTSYSFLEAYFIMAIIYLLLTLIAGLILKLIEKKLNGVKFSLNPFRFKRRLQ